MSRLPDDCFALPPGVHWTPVDEALAALEARLTPLAGVETVALDAAAGRILAEDAIARRAHPATDNAAVDGYAFRHPDADPNDASRALEDGARAFRLLEGRSAAGAPWAGVVPSGAALRVLTGAAMPDGADTVVLQEDVTLDGEGAAAVLRFRPPKRPGANRRRAGENLDVGDQAAPAGAILSPQALAQLASADVDRVVVRRPLRVGVLSTGDELVAPGEEARPDQVIDSNRPMLIDMVRRFGAVPVDLGRAPDDRAALERALDAAAEAADALVVSGGASGGEEDHMSQALAAAGADGAFHLWRIAMKPGRPLALGVRRGQPVFGLPGNPVAAFVCAALFVRPALRRLAGAPWRTPRPIPMPLGFDYPKKPGRREFLRVRVGADGRLEKYRSEGSGLIEGLVWSDGLLDLAHERGPIAAGESAGYLPFAAFGLAP